jgi:riboflavin kinase/FMN adenylyltransferase
MTCEVFRSAESADGRFGPCVLAIGNFDGVHIGHRALIERAVAAADARGAVPAVLTFHPHPAAVVAPHRRPRLICSLDKRIELLGAAGIRRVLVLPFTPEVARLSPADFIRQIVIEALGTRAIFVGENFHFGHKQAGTPAVLEELGKAWGVEVTFVAPVTFRGQVVSSTAVRQALEAGRVVRAAHLLGRCYSVEGPVVSGRGIGSKQTVPTLNLRPDPELLVPMGIYVTETLEPATERRWSSVTSSGYNVTFGATEHTVETYLLDKLENESPHEIEVRFRHFLRAEEKYPDAQTLKAQILKDVARAEVYWRRAGRFRLMEPSIY